MQRSVLENWIDGLSEREFDGPFITLLRAQGFFDIHFTHGQYEFGKDFIAKRVEGKSTVQYGFQSKAGDIAGGTWDQIHGQIEELVATWLAHPNYDKNLPLEHRLVCTGELKGKAVLSARQYREQVLARGAGNFLVWSRGNLVDMLSGQSPEYPVLPMPTLIQTIIASELAGTLSEEHLLTALTGCFAPPTDLSNLRVDLLHLSILSTFFWSRGRLFHAVRSAHHGVRQALHLLCTESSEPVKAEYERSLENAVSFGLAAAQQLAALKPIDLFYGSASSIGANFAYPLASHRTAEFLALAVVHAASQDDWSQVDALGADLADFVQRNPGCKHPLSDRFATSLVVALVALHIADQQQTLQDLIIASTRWCADRLEDLGMAGPYAEPQQELDWIFGASFDFIQIEERKESLLFVALCDCGHELLPDRFPDIANEFLAVDAIPSALHARDSIKGCYRGLAGEQTLVNLRYPDTAGGVLEHHALQPCPREIQNVGGACAPWLMAGLCGDRLFTDALRHLPTRPPSHTTASV